MNVKHANWNVNQEYMNPNDLWIVFDNYGMEIISVHADEHLANEKMAKIVAASTGASPERQYCTGKLSEGIKWICYSMYKNYEHDAD